MPEGKTKVSVWIPNEILEKLDSKYPNNRADAIRYGLDILLMDSKKEPLMEYSLEDIGILKGQLMESKDHIDTLKMQLIQANRDKESLTNIWNTHVAQNQSLINLVGDTELQMEAVHKKVDYIVDDIKLLMESNKDDEINQVDAASNPSEGHKVKKSKWMFWK